MEVPFNSTDNNIFFEFDTYEEFTKERVKLNYEHTLKLWYSRPTDLSNIDNRFIQQRTRQQQRATLRKIKVFYFCSKLFKRTCLKKKMYSKGTRLCNDIFNMSSVRDESLYEIYQSVVRSTIGFLNKGKRYDPAINFDELFKAGRLLWTMIAIQVEFNVPLAISDSLFGYTMLYPYTDDFVDSTSVSQEAKKEFARIFHNRLLIGESNYDPKSRFDGKQSKVTELQLPLLLQPYADKIGKIFDMVKFVENDWARRGEHECVYMSLATIHDSQIKSTLQHARPRDGYAPTMAQIEQVSADKGGASLIAAGFLIEGHLTWAKMAYLEYLGFGMQLVDDLQDVPLDMENDHRTIFTQSIADGQTLDEPTARLIQYWYCVPAYEKFADNYLVLSDAETDATLANYVYILIMKSCVLLILEAASRLQKYYSKEFFRELMTFNPLPHKFLRRVGIENKVMGVLRDQWF
ncbi:hypothetical protein I4U23_016495 [Adineta vaga]|nr:hypothetical protein I4U23_016495 [Adineta vaga]